MCILHLLYVHTINIIRLLQICQFLQTRQIKMTTNSTKQYTTWKNISIIEEILCQVMHKQYRWYFKTYFRWKIPFAKMVVRSDSLLQEARIQTIPIKLQEKLPAGENSNAENDFSTWKKIFSPVLWSNFFPHWQCTVIVLCNHPDHIYYKPEEWFMCQPICFSLLYREPSWCNK